MIPSVVLAVAALGFCQLALTQTTTTANATSTHTATPTPIANHARFEIDVVFPRTDTIYNFTDYIPIVFAFQNLSAAAALGPLRFSWAIMPYGRIGNLNPGGVFEDTWSMEISPENITQFENSDGSAYILVNSTNTTKWDHPPHYGWDSVYSLQWYVTWDAFHNMCRDSRVFERILFNVRPESDLDETGPNPGDLGNVTESCPQFGSMTEIVGDDPESCLNVRTLPFADANPCAVKLDASKVSSISSEAALLPRPTPTSSTTTMPSSTNGCGATALPVRPILVTVGLFGSLQLFSF